MKTILFFILAVLSFNAFAKVHGIKDQITIINNTQFSKDFKYGGNVMKSHSQILVAAGQRIQYDTSDLPPDNRLLLPVLSASGITWDQLQIRVSASNPETGETTIVWPLPGMTSCFYEGHLCVNNSSDSKTVTITEKQ